MRGTAATVQRARRTPRRARSSAWNVFASILATALAALADEQFLIISTKRGNRYVQFARRRGDHGTSEIRAEAVSNAYLAKPERLTRKDVAALRELGWQAPTHAPRASRVPHGSPNFFRDYVEPHPYRAIAKAAVRTLVEVYRAGAPEELEYRSFQDPGGKDVALPSLGIDEATPPPAPSRGEGFEAARKSVLRAIRDASGQSDAGFDKDGDIVVTYGGAVLYVHVHDSPRWVRVFSAIVTGVTADDRLLRHLNELNHGATLVRFLCANGAVWASSDAFADPLVPRHVVHACHVVGDVASDLRESLTREFLDRPVLPGPSPAALKN